MKLITCHPPRAQEGLANCVETEVMLEEAPCYHVVPSVLKGKLQYRAALPRKTIKTKFQKKYSNECEYLPQIIM